SGAGQGGTSYLITDAGVKYPLASAETAERLGYGGSEPVAVPAALLGLLPTGPSLDPARALASGAAAPEAAAPGAVCGR
ncbi:type VII secretion protein EccB, partial [Streptomyces sp. WAC06614]|uniref:type VII secretion protein EccB n=1 Tax=Streptomyces sp. WAC06614 TaxID=2487416 RepID=UPI000FBE988F